MTLVILVLSFARLPSLMIMPKGIPCDKIVHFFMYLILTLILMYDFTKDTNLNFRKYIFVFVCILFPVLLGALTEILQALFFYPRIAEWVDWLSNIAGVFIGWGLFLLYKRKIKT